ncbi:type IV pilus biogenesis protein PilM [Schlesneria sp. DSM 10557]|uniref:type IV pilus biogenesis protein PilM n=1 Tax=Schlesneria sp. DSM 10557 TaxID=3044399 RepID=UPI0035A0DAF2
MADLLALSWDRNRLTGIEFSPTAADPKVAGGFSVNWPEQPVSAKWLRETLRRHNINAKQVVVALAREDAVLRLLELPSVPDDELPTLVRFQAAARTAQSLDQLLLDFLPLPLRAGVSQKEVWLATALLSTVTPLRTLLEEAGLDLTHLTLSSLALTELIARGEAKQALETSGASLIVLRDQARMELAVVSQRQLIAAHAVKWSSINDIPPVTKMLAEVSRLLVQVQAWLPEGTLHRAWVIGDDADVGELPAALAKRWNCPAERFDPFLQSGMSGGSAKLEGPSSHYAIAAGLAFTQSGAITPKLDLLNPRQPPPKRDPRKPYYAAAAAAALLVLATGTAVVQQSLAAYDAEINQNQLKESKLKEQLKEGEPTFVASKALEDWRARGVNQLQQIAELHQVMEGTDKLVISDYRFDPGSGDSIARIKAAGNAKTRFEAEQFAQRLADLPKFQNGIKQKPITSGKGDSEYQNRFEVEMEMGPQRLKPAPAAKPPSPPAAKP